MSAFPLSYSKIKIYQQCELRFDYQYHSATHKDKGSQGDYGKAVHKAIELYCIKDKPLPPHLKRFEPMLDRLKARTGDKHYELQIAVRADKSICDWWAKDCWNRGVVDALVINKNRCVAIDWKTGKPSDDELQMKLMAAFLFELFQQLDEVTTTYVWLFHPGALSPPVTYHRWMLRDLWEHFEAKSLEINSSCVAGVFKPKPSGLCPWCPAFDVCSYKRGKRR